MTIPHSGLSKEDSAGSETRTGPAPLRWVAFDAVGTLIHPDPPVRHVYFESARRFGSRFTEAEIELRFQQTYRRHLEHTSQDLRTSESLEEEGWRRIVAEVLSDLHDPQECFRELFAWFGSPSAWRVYPDAGPALARLSALGMQTAVASNFDHRLHAVLDGLPELAAISPRIVSSEIGYRKPATEFYQALSERTRTALEHIAMIGDSHINDVVGARSAGMRAVWLDRRRPADRGRAQNLIQAVAWLTDSPNTRSCEPAATL